MKVSIPMIALALGLSTAGVCSAEDAKILATRPPSLTVTVRGGSFESADGKTVALKDATLSFADVETQSLTLTDRKAPANHEAWMDPWGVGWASGRAVGGVITPKPKVDGKMLGVLYRQVIVDSVEVATADGSRRFERDVDFLVNTDSGQVANIADRLGKPGAGKLTVSCRYALQRLDLIQADADGTLSVKTGTSSPVCPALPEPDAGCVAVAGVHISPYPVSAGKPAAIAQDTIYPIVRHEPVAPVNPGTIAGTLGKLQTGQDVAIAFLGDSITLGAEAGPWWSDRSKTYTGRVMAGLEQRYPEAEITEIAAYQGGITTKKGSEFFVQKVQPAKPDLLLIALGANDADGPDGKPPRNPAPQFKEDVRAMIAAARSAGTEVMLVTSLMPYTNNAEPRIGQYRQAMLELAKEENVACADVQAAWADLAKRGIPPFTQLHNNVNHPGPFGMTVYSDTILRFFK